MDNNNKNETLYNIVFNGYFVTDNDPIEVKKRFAEKFGEQKANLIFAQSTTVLKRNTSKEKALLLQKMLINIGLKTDLKAVVSSTSELSLQEDVEQARIETTHSQSKSNLDNIAPKPLTVKKKTSTKVYKIEELDAAFFGEIEPKAPSTLYFLTLIPVTFLMLLLPLIYLAITLFSAYAVYWLITNGFDYVLVGTPSRMFIRIVSFGALVIGSALLTIFLAKPFMSRIRAARQPVRLDPQKEKPLFHLVERITKAVGSPMPSEILVDSQVNASAHLSKGVFSKSLTLTIGLPLLYGMNVQTVSGILAHEFGHFTQRLGMRSTYIVGSINNWFYSKTHEHDNWDDWVDDLMESEYGFLQAGAHIAKFGSQLCKAILIGLAGIARLISLTLIRQMEFDADRYEIALLGSTQYRKTAIRLRELATAYQLIFDDLNNAKIANSIEETNTSVFDTHPSDQARITKALESNSEAKFKHQGTAEYLLRDIHRYSKLSTLQWYRSFGFTVALEDLTPLEEVKQANDKQAQVINASKKYFGKLEGFTKYVRFPDEDFDQKPQELSIELSKSEFVKSAKNEITTNTEKYFQSRKLLQSLYKKQKKYDEALYHLNKGESIDKKSFMLTHGSIEEVHSLLAKLTQHIQKELDILNHFSNLQGKRLNTGLEIAVENKPELATEINSLKRAYKTLIKVDPIVNELYRANNKLDEEIYNQEEYSGNEFNSRALNAAIGDSNKHQTRLLRALEQTRDPFLPQQTLNTSISEQKNLEGSQADNTLNEGQRLIRQFKRMLLKIEGRMAELALEVEDKIFKK